MKKTLVIDTDIDGIKYCWNGHPMQVKKQRPMFDINTGEITGYSYDITCSKPIWRCICRHGIWYGNSKKKLAI